MFSQVPLTSLFCTSHHLWGKWHVGIVYRLHQRSLHLKAVWWVIGDSLTGLWKECYLLRNYLVGIRKTNTQNKLMVMTEQVFLSSEERMRLCACIQVTQSCLTLCNPTDFSPPGSSVPGILQEGILEWVAMPFSRGSSWPRDRTHIFCSSWFAGRFFTAELLGKPHIFILFSWD